MKLGAQFYTLRKRAQTPEGIEDCFHTMHDIGYEVAQMSGIGQIEAERLWDLSCQYQLPITCTHNSLAQLLTETDRIIRDHEIYHCPVIGLGGMPNEYYGSVGNVREFIKVTTEMRKKIAEAGMVFAYHNHAKEFDDIGGVDAFTLLFEEAPDLHFIPDVYWMSYAGKDPVKLLRQISEKRTYNVHYKDMRTSPAGEICPCGAGVVDFKAITRACEEMGIQNALVEQDNAPDLGDEFLQMKESFDFLRPIIHK